MSETRETLDSKVTVDDEDTVTAARRAPAAQASADDQQPSPARKPDSETPAPSDSQDPSRTRSQPSAAPDTIEPVKPVDLAGDMEDLSDNDRESRRHALRSMLAASEARQQGSMRSRRPTLAIGERLAICSGVYKDLQGVILDADFIHSRVFLQIDGIEEAQWIEFARIAARLPL